MTNIANEMEGERQLMAEMDELRRQKYELLDMEARVQSRVKVAQETLFQIENHLESREVLKQEIKNLTHDLRQHFDRLAHNIVQAGEDFNASAGTKLTAIQEMQMKYQSTGNITTSAGTVKANIIALENELDGHLQLIEKYERCLEVSIDASTVLELSLDDASALIGH